MFRTTWKLACSLASYHLSEVQATARSKARRARKRLSVERLEPRLALATDVVLYDAFDLALSHASDGDSLDGHVVAAGHVHWLGESDIVFDDQPDDRVIRTGAVNRLQAVLPFSFDSFTSTIVTLSADLRPLDAGDETHYAAIGILENFNLDNFNSNSENYWFALRDSGSWNYFEGNTSVEDGTIPSFDPSLFHRVEITFNDTLNSVTASVDGTTLFTHGWTDSVDEIDAVGMELQAVDSAVSRFQVRSSTPSGQSLFGVSDTGDIRSLEGNSIATSFPARDYGKLIFGPNQGWSDVLTGVFAPDLTRNQVISRNAAGEWILADVTQPPAQMRSIGQWGPNDGWVDVQIADVNGDGLSDIIGRNFIGDWWAGVTTLDSDRQPTLENHKLGNWGPNDGWHDVLVGDFNGDGLDDVIGRNLLGDWYAGVMRLDNSGNPVFDIASVSHWNESDGWVDVRVADVNGDRLDDIVGRNVFGGWWAQIAHLPTIPGTLDVTIEQIGAANDNWQDVRVADVNGDGLSDIVGRNLVGDWWGGITTVSPDPLLNDVKLGHWGPDDGWQDVRVGDYNGDGLDDVAGRNVIGDWWVAQTEIPGLDPEFENRAVGNWTPDVNWDFVKEVPNSVPTIVAPASVQVPGDQTSFIPISATDPDGDPVEFVTPVVVISKGGTGNPIVTIQSNSLLTINPNGATGHFKAHILAMDRVDICDFNFLLEIL